MTKVAAIYARVSSDRQKENHTIASQMAALTEDAETHEYRVPAEWRFQDEGYSGATLLRPGVLWEDRTPSAAAHQATVAETPGAGEPRQCQPRKAPPGLDRDSGSGLDQRRDFCPGARTTGAEPAAFSPAHHRTVPVTGNASL